MAESVGRQPYLEQLQALLPRGAAWPRDPEAVLTLLLDAVAASLADVDIRAVGLLGDVRPNETVALLPDWERVAGIPDECSDTASTISQRIAALLTKVVARANLNVETFGEVTESFGVAATVEEHDQTRANNATTLPTGQGRWRFVWWITLPASGDATYFSVLSPVDMPLVDVERNTELECRLQSLAPAHTLLRVAYA